GDLSSDSEATLSVQWCELLWAVGTGQLPSIIAINIRKLTGVLGTGDALGFALQTHLRCDLRFHVCSSYPLCIAPRRLTAIDTDYAFVQDGQFGNFQNEDALVLAHELGHVLLLGHGNGLDDDHNGTLPPGPGVRLYD